jgi:hypothetical protein
MSSLTCHAFGYSQAELKLLLPVSVADAIVKDEIVDGSGCAQLEHGHNFNLPTRGIDGNAVESNNIRVPQWLQYLRLQLSFVEKLLDGNSTAPCKIGIHAGDLHRYLGTCIPSLAHDALGSSA